MKGTTWFGRTLACAGLLFGFSAGVWADAPRASVGPSVDPTDGVWHNEAFMPSVNEPIVPQHPPIDEIPPMPMPHSDDWQFDPNVSDSVVVYDAETGEAREIPLGRPSGLTGAQGGQDFEGLDSEFVEEWTSFGRAFNDMDTVSNLTASPWRRNVKLVMRFTDQNNQTRFFVCSGTMQDSGVVFTAGHCVYARSPNNIDIFDWAEEVWVYPAWDGSGNITPQPPGHAEHWGWARSTSYIAGSGWINDGDFDRDVAAMRLRRTNTRQVGMLTGWFGWAWGASCSTIQDRTYHNASYPSENCAGGLHTGRDMYYWFGRFDSCPGNQLQIDTTGGCFNAGWGGMSGSGAYYIDDGSRFTHAICSNSNRSTRARYAKNWEGFIDAFQDMRDDVRGNTPDYELLRFRTDGSLSVDAGDQIGPSSVSVTNPTNANPAPRSFTLRVYLSSNNNVQSSDTLLATYTYSNVDFSAMQLRTFNIPEVTIPSNTSPGTYWLGAVLDPNTDSNPSNNNVWGWDAQQIQVTLSAPPAVTNPSPANGATDQPLALQKSWSASPTASQYRVYRGTSAGSLNFAGQTTGTTWSVPASQQDYGQTYYWRVDARNSAGTTPGPVWSYSTQSERIGPRVLIAAAASTSGMPDVLYTDPRDKLLATGRFSAVDIHDTTVSVPSASLLQNYDAVLTWSNGTHTDNTLLGNRLADYADAGGGVVNAVFNTSTTTSGRFLGGRWITDGHEIIPSQGGNQSGATTLGNTLIPGHPTMHGVNELEGSSLFRPATLALTSHGTKVATYADNPARTLVAVSEVFHNRVDLGLYPPSSDVNANSWDGDGADLMANALVYAARNSSGWISTMMSGGNGGASGWGVFFDVEVTNSAGVTFTGLDFNARNAEGNSVDVEVYTIVGGSDLGDAGGASNSSSGWRLAATGRAVAGDNNKASSVFFDSPFSLDQGTYGMMVRTIGAGQNYTNGDGQNQSFNTDNLTLSLGMARNNADSGFGGSMFYPRVWNGSLFYEPGEAGCIADWNGDGEVDINDFFAYLNDFSNGDPRADLNNDGEIDINDFFIFLQEFEAGC